MELKANVRITVASQQIVPAPPDPVREYNVRRFRIIKKDFEIIGFTPLCQGCRSITRGSPPQNHSELCRTRVERELVRIGDERVSRSKDRVIEHREAAENTKRIMMMIKIVRTTPRKRRHKRIHGELHMNMPIESTRETKER